MVCRSQPSRPNINECAIVVSVVVAHRRHTLVCKTLLAIIAVLVWAAVPCRRYTVSGGTA